MAKLFIELEVPEDDGDGNWFVCRDGDYAGFLHHDKLVHQDIEDDVYNTTGWFNSEVEAHEAASDYYSYFNRAYPYYKEYSAALQKVIDDSRGPQVMEFE